MESLSNVAVAKVCWWIAAQSSQYAGDTALQCTVRYLSPRYKCTAAGERAESCAGGGWWRCWVPSKNRWTGALPPSRLSPCPHCPQPRPPASVTPERNVPTRGSTVRVVLVIKAGVRMNGVTYIRCCKLLNNWAKPFKQIQMVLAEVGDDPVPAPNFL